MSIEIQEITLFINGLNTNLSRAFLYNAAQLVKGKEFKEPRIGHFRHNIPWTKIIVGIENTDAQSCAHLEEIFRSENVEFRHYNPESRSDVQSIISDANYALIIPDTSEDCLIRFDLLADSLAKSEKLQFVLYVSNEISSVGQSKWAQEREIMERFILDMKVDCCILRCGIFMEFFLCLSDEISQGRLPMILHGDSYWNPVSLEDVAKFCCKILKDPSSYVKKQIILSGHERFNMQNMANQISNILGHNVIFIRESKQRFYEMLRMKGINKTMSEGIIEFFELLQNGKISSNENKFLFEELDGETVSLSEFFNKNIDIFTKRSVIGRELVGEGIHKIKHVKKSLKAILDDVPIEYHEAFQKVIEIILDDIHELHLSAKEHLNKIVEAKQGLQQFEAYQRIREQSQEKTRVVTSIREPTTQSLPGTSTYTRY